MVNDLETDFGTHGEDASNVEAGSPRHGRTTSGRVVEAAVEALTIFSSSRLSSPEEFVGIGTRVLSVEKFVLKYAPD